VNHNIRPIHAQPCDTFIDNSLDSNVHQCPQCGGIRRFCENCCRDHHDGGWESCYLHQLCVLKKKGDTPCE
jgi:hypothetical protein